MAQTGPTRRRKQRLWQDGRRQRKARSGSDKEATFCEGVYNPIRQSFSTLNKILNVWWNTVVAGWMINPKFVLIVRAYCVLVVYPAGSPFFESLPLIVSPFTMQTFLCSLLFLGGVLSFNFFQAQQNPGSANPLPHIPKTTVAPTNVTCRSRQYAKCFAGQCPDKFTCLPTNVDDPNSAMCCPNADVVIPDAGCQDFLEGCSSLKCDSKDTYDFAVANCAKTCNFCNGVVSPQYACADLLDDCNERAKAGYCQLIGFFDMMAIYCPRSCDMCLYSNDAYPCGNTLNDCAQRGTDFCDSVKTSAFQSRAGCGKFCGKC